MAARAAAAALLVAVVAIGVFDRQHKAVPVQFPRSVPTTKQWNVDI